MAVIRALQCLKEPCAVTLCSDSQYVCNAIEKGLGGQVAQNGWRKADKSPALNTDLWEILLHLLEIHRVEIVWVRGHNGHPENERCDVWPLRAPNAPKPPVQSFDSWRCKRVPPLSTRASCKDSPLFCHPSTTFATLKLFCKKGLQSILE